MKKRLYFKIILFIALFLAAALIAGIVFFFPEDMQKDLERLSGEEYDTVFLSMYPVDNYEEEPYTYWRAMDAVVTSHEIPNIHILKKYLGTINETGTTTTVYLGVLPEKLNSAKLAELLLTYPNIRFEVILPYPQLDYWLSLSPQKCDSLLQIYRDFIPPLLNHGNFSPYFFGGSEWLIANPANYENDFLTNTEISETLMLHSDIDHEYVITANTQPSPTASIDKLAALIAQNRQSPAKYPDLSDWSIVFMGDSVIGNYTDTTSIPLVTGGLTGATVYNVGFGGGSATEFPDNNCSLPDAVNAMIQKDVTGLPIDQPLYEGMVKYIRDNPSGQLCVVINYGLNDYFGGAPISSDDPYDTCTFAGAVRTAVKALQEAYPDVRILLNTPNFTTFFNNGMDPRFDVNYTLADYADTLKALAAELGVELLDNYNELGITPGNSGEYLADGCHPNANGRYIIGRRIALKLGE